MKENKKLPIVLVIGPFDDDWYKLCEDCQDKFRIVQANFEDIGISSYSDYPIVTITPPKEIIHESQKKRQVITPTLIVIRSCVHYVGRKCGENPDYRNVLYGFIHANIPMINTFDSILFELERPIMFGLLKMIQSRIGNENFPLINQTFYSDSSEMITAPEAPFVIKYSFPHAGYGKIRVRDHQDFQDIRSIVAIDNHYCAAEPLIDSEYELRIVFIYPDYYRCQKRESLNWKVNYGGPNIREEVEMNSMYKLWVDEVRKEVPGMLFFAIDAIVDKEGKHYILEVNGSSQGFTPEHKEESLLMLKKLVISKLDEIKGDVNLKKEVVLDDDMVLKKLNLENEIRDLKVLNNQKDKEIEWLRRKLTSKSSGKKKFSFSYNTVAVLVVVFIVIISGFLYWNYK